MLKEGMYVEGGYVEGKYAFKLYIEGKCVVEWGVKGRRMRNKTNKS